MKMACRRIGTPRRTLLLQADRLLARDLAERVHAHLHVGQLDAGAVARDADAHGVVDDALHADEDALQRHFIREELVTTLRALVSGLWCTAAGWRCWRRVRGHQRLGYGMLV